MNFSAEEVKQYQRHLSLPGFGAEAQSKLKNASVLVVGAGGLGCPALQYLVAAAWAKSESWMTTWWMLPTCKGRFSTRTMTLGNRRQRLRPTDCQAQPLRRNRSCRARLTRDNAKDASRNIELGGRDGFLQFPLPDQRCLRSVRQDPLYGAIHQFEGQVSVFNLGDGPTYRCLFPEPPPAGTVPNCAETGVVGVLPGIIGCMQALEAIKLITGKGDSISGKLLLYDAMSNTTKTLRLSPSAQSREISQLPKETKSCEMSGGAPDALISEIEPVELVGMMEERPDLLLLDVREDWERELSRIDPSSHCPLGEFSSLDGPTLPADFELGREVVVYCKAGVRSMMACRALQEMGFKKLYNLSGGMMRWMEDVGSPPPVG